MCFIYTSTEIIMSQILNVVSGYTIQLFMVCVYWFMGVWEKSLSATYTCIFVLYCKILKNVKIGCKIVQQTILSMQDTQE